MISDEEIIMLAGALATQDRKWKIAGKTRTPTIAEIRQLVEHFVDTIRESEESLSIEIGGLLIKRSDDFIDIYAHVAELEYDEEM